MIYHTKNNISVLMPVFLSSASANALQNLEMAINSVVEQEYPAEVELLIVDDGSPIPVEEIIESEKINCPDYLRIVRLRHNSGLVNALNIGLNRARFEMIARIDADDYWEPDKVRKQTERFAKDADLSILGTGMTLIYEDDKKSEVHIRKDGWSEVLKFFVEVGCPFPHGSIIARKDIYKLLGGYTHSSYMAHCEDYALWSIWVRFFKPGMIEESLYNYRVSPESVSSKFSVQQRLASGRINGAFARLGMNRTLPDYMSEIASIFNVSLIQAGVLCYRLWHYRPLVNLPESAIRPLINMLPDRQLIREITLPEQIPLDWTELLLGFYDNVDMTSENSSIVSIV